jgi:ParB-like chromosome segregation protein Spo0J
MMRFDPQRFEEIFSRRLLTMSALGRMTGLSPQSIANLRDGGGGRPESIRAALAALEVDIESAWRTGLILKEDRKPRPAGKKGPGRPRLKPREGDR